MLVTHLYRFVHLLFVSFPHHFLCLFLCALSLRLRMCLQKVVLLMYVALYNV